MGDVVNLKLQRKRKVRAEKESEAAANRARFGLPKRERDIAEIRREQEEKRLDGHKREE